MSAQPDEDRSKPGAREPSQATSQQMQPTTSRRSDDAAEACFICLATERESGERMERLCKCPRPCHARCLARWQLQSAGKDEEGRCRFCNEVLPLWQDTLAPVRAKAVCPVMAIKWEGKTYKLKVQPGPDGLAEFQKQVRTILGFDITEEFDVTFECSVNGEKMQLSGLSSYGAATQCAAYSASQREVKPKRTHRRRSHARSYPGGAAAAAEVPPPASSAAHAPSSTADHIAMPPAQRSAVPEDDEIMFSSNSPVRAGHSHRHRRVQQSAMFPSLSSPVPGGDVTPTSLTTTGMMPAPPASSPARFLAIPPVEQRVVGGSGSAFYRSSTSPLTGSSAQSREDASPSGQSPRACGRTATGYLGSAGSGLFHAGSSGGAAGSYASPARQASSGLNTFSGMMSSAPGQGSLVRSLTTMPAMEASPRMHPALHFSSTSPLAGERVQIQTRLSEGVREEGSVGKGQKRNLGFLGSLMRVCGMKRS